MAVLRRVAWYYEEGTPFANTNVLYVYPIGGARHQGTKLLREPKSLEAHDKRGVPHPEVVGQARRHATVPVLRVTLEKAATYQVSPPTRLHKPEPIIESCTVDFGAQ